MHCHPSIRPATCATRPASPHRVGFTLIELLVVISIIALLVGILLPVLGNARAAAQSVSCKSMMRQYQIATDLYANDYDGYMVDASNHLDPEKGLPPYFSRSEMSGDIGRCAGDQTTQSLGRLGEITLDNGDTERISIGASQNAMSDSARMTGGGLMAFWSKRDQPQFTPSKVFTWADWQNDTGQAAITKARVRPDTGSLGSMVFRHNGGSNAAFMDGHVSMMRTDLALENGGHDLADGETWGAPTPIRRSFKVYSPFRGPTGRTRNGYMDRGDWPNLTY